MNTEGWIALGALVVAIYAAIAPVIRDEAKKLTMYVELIYFEERRQLILINSGKRPITIWTISATPSDGYDPIPSNALFEAVDLEFPLVLEPNGSFALPLSSIPFEGDKGDPIITVYDIDGKAYSGYSKRTKNAKFGGLGKE